MDPNVLRWFVIGAKSEFTEKFRRALEAPSKRIPVLCAMKIGGR
jgi:hypothetical protein